MKTLKQVQKEIDYLLKKDYSVYEDDKQWKEKQKTRKRVAFLNQCKKYLQSEPKPEFVSQEVLRVEKLINAVLDRFSEPEKATRKDVAVLKKKHESEYEIPKYRKQLKTLYFLNS